MKVIVYVEGPSDVAAMNELFRPLINLKAQAGTQIRFAHIPKGDGKKTVLLQVPARAVEIVLNDADAYVVALPDLYPRNKGFPHETAPELLLGIRTQFENGLRHKGHEADERIRGRFKAFCFKHDLEALLLAAEGALASRLGQAKIDRTWQVPVEDQNQDQPPKRIVEALFKQYGERYEETLDAPLILSSVDYHVIAEQCPQQFKPFVAFLESL